MRVLVWTLLMLAVLAPAASAQGTVETGTVLDEAARALEGDPVYVHPDAEDVLSPEGADSVRGRIRSAGVGPVYVAVLPPEALDEAGGSVRGVLYALHERLGRAGVYAAAAGGRFEAGGPPGTGQAASDAVAEHGGQGLEAVLIGFLGELSGSGDGSGSADGSWLLLGLLGVGGGAFALSRVSRRRQERADLEEVKTHVRDELVALGDEIRALDIDVQMPDANPEAVATYHRAVSAYDRAETAWERARRVDDLEPVGAALEEGRWALLSTRALLEGREPPERRAPCFFDPRHGPSTRDVEWAPFDGVPRMVPACEADALRVEEGYEPHSREVLVGGRSMPYWQAGPLYAPFMGGFFGGGLLPGILMGSMLGGMFGGAGAAYGDDGFGGDFGGGDLGGLGGGGFDVGGGDF